MKKLVAPCLLASLILALLSVPASARLVVAAEGTLIAGATNTAFVTKTLVLAEPVYYRSAVFYNTGTNVVTATLSKVDGNLAVSLASGEISADAGATYPTYDPDTVVSNAYPITALTLAATKTAGTTNGTESVLFYRVYGDTDR